MGFIASRSLVRRTLFTAPTTCPKTSRRAWSGRIWTFPSTGPIVEELNAIFVFRLHTETNQLILAEINTTIPYYEDGMCAQVVPPPAPGFEPKQPGASSLDLQCRAAYHHLLNLLPYPKRPYCRHSRTPHTRY